MKSTGKVILFALLWIGLFVMPATAQEEGSGTIILGISTEGQSTDETPFLASPYFCYYGECVTIVGLMNFGLLGIDYNSGWFAPKHGGIVESWEFSHNNQILTLHLRDDLYWSDGVRISSADVLMSYELGTNPESSEKIGQFEAAYKQIEAPDEQTIIITFNQGSCGKLNVVQDTLSVLPAHIYRDLIAEVTYADLINHEWFQNPTVVSGPFKWGELSDDKTITLLRNENFTAATIHPERFIQKTAPSNNALMEMFWSGEVNVLDYIPLERRDEFVNAAAAGEVQIFEYPFNGWNFIAMNQADPSNPQPALDENGNRIEQGLHPIFGDKLTRHALAYAIDVDALIDEAYWGYATRITAHIPPGSWAYNHELTPIPYDPKLALSILAEAGWVPENPDLPASEANKLICQDCLYARQVDPTFNGAYLEFELLVHQFQDERVIEGTVIQKQLAQIGITVDLQMTDFETLISAVTGQIYDTALLGFFGNYPDKPESSWIFNAVEDQPDTGFNFFSFYNEAYFALEETAMNVPGCGLTERANIYRQMQAIIQDEMPAIFLYTGKGMYAARNEVQGFSPYQFNLFWNIASWSVHEGD